MLSLTDEILDLNLFAHIHNDAHLVGTRALTGNRFKNTVAFLLEYTQACEKGETTFGAENLKYIRPLLHKLEILQELDQEEENVRKAANRRALNIIEQAEITQDLAGKITQKILSLPTGEKEATETNSLLMPGGWLNAGSGHRLVYEFKKDADGNTLFLIHNTGTGLEEHHQTVLEHDKERFCPIKAYLIPKESAVSPENLSWFIQQLLIPRLLLNGHSWDEKNVYKIFELIKRIEGSEVDPLGYTKQDNLTASQRSGTCTEKVLHQMSESAFPDKGTYKQFIYGFKKFSLDKFSSKIERMKMIDEPGVRNQISLAIENTARLLEKEKYFSKEMREKEFVFLKELQSRFARVEEPRELPLNKEKIQDGLNALSTTPDSLRSLSTRLTELSVLSTIFADEITTKLADPNAKPTDINALSAKLFKLQTLPAELAQLNTLSTILLAGLSISSPKEDRLRSFFLQSNPITLPPDASVTIHTGSKIEKENIDTKNLQDNVLFNYKSIEMLQALHQFSAEITKLGTQNLELAYASLENFFIHWPLPPQQEFETLKETLAQLKTEDEKKAFFQILEKINEQYSTIKKQLIGEQITPKYYINQLGFFTLITCLQSTPPLALVDENAGVSFLDSFQEAGASHIAKQFLSPYVASENFQFDNKLRKIRGVLFKEFPINKIMPQYKDYNSKAGEHLKAIITRSGLMEPLEKLFQSEKIDKSKYTVERLISCKSEAIYTLQLYLDAKDDDKKKFVEQFCEVNNIPAEGSDTAFEKLKQLEAHLQRQHQVELMLANTWSTISSTPLSEEIKNAKLKMIWPGRDSQKEPEHQPFFNLFIKESTLQEPQTLKWKKQSVIDLMLNVFTKIDMYNGEPLITSNTIQFLAFLKKTAFESLLNSKETLWMRAFMHLRTSAFQLPLTVEFFSKNRELTIDPAKQVYLEKCLFHPEYLIQALENEPMTIQNLKHFIQSGIATFTKEGVPEQTALFYMKIDSKLDLYEFDFYQNRLLCYEKDSLDHKNTTEALRKIKIKLNTSLNKINTFLLEKNITTREKSTLHLQRAILLNHFLNQALDSNKKSETLSALIESLLLKEHYYRPMKDQDALEEDLLENANLKIIQQNALFSIRKMYKENSLNTNDDFLKKALSKTLSQVSLSFKEKIERGELKWIIDLPYIHLSEHTDNLPVVIDLTSKPADTTMPNFCNVNLQNSKIKIGSLLPSELPDSILNTKAYKKLFGNFEPTCFSNLEGTFFEFEYKNNFYRIIVKAPGEYVIQCQFNVLAQGSKWYEAQDIQKFDNLQTIFKEDKNLAWVSVEEPNAAVSKTQILIKDKDPTQSSSSYLYQSEENRLIALDNALNTTGYNILQPTSILHQIIRRFEDPNFVIALEKGEKYRIELPRYNLNLIVKPKQQAAESTDTWDITLEGEDYALDLNQAYEILPGLPSPLVFKKGSETRVIVPIQKFLMASELEKALPNLADTKETTEYHELIQDTGDHFRQSQFDAYQNPKNIKKVPIEKYKGTEFFINLKRENDELIPNNIEDGLYLSYIYLAKQQPEKAFKTLEYCEKHFRQLSGTEKELDYLRWIVDCLPARINLDKSNESTEKMDLLTPEVLAIKLKALSMLALFKMDNPDFKVEPVEAAKDSSYDQQFKVTQSQLRANFFKTIQTNIKTLYHKYHHTLNQVSFSLRLSEHEKLQLLRTVFIGDKKAAGPLAIEWRRLEIRCMQVKIKNLQAKCSEYTHKELAVPEDLKNEITNLEKRLLKTKIIWTKTKEYANISLTVPNYRRTDWNIAEMNVKSDAEIYKLMADAINANPKLDIGSLLKKLENLNNISDLIVNFPKICKALYKKEISGEDQEKLLKFCKKTIIAYRNYETGTTKSNLEPLCAMLYHFMQDANQRKFDDAIKDYKKRKFSSRPGEFRADDHYENNHFYFGEKKADEKSMLEWFNHFAALNNQSSDKLKIIFEGSKDVEKEFVTTFGLVKKLEQEARIPKSCEIKPLETSPHYAREFFLKKDFFTTEISQQLRMFYEQWAIEEKLHLEQMTLLKNQYKESQKEKDFLKRSKIESEIDNQAGSQLHTHGKNQLALSIAFLGNAECCDKFYNQAVKKQKILADILKDKKLALMKFANQTGDIVSLGQRFHQVELTDLFSLFLRNDVNAYMKTTQLDEASCIKLHNDIANYLTLSAHKNHFSRIIKKIDEYPDLRQNNIREKSTSEAKTTLHAVGELLTEINSVNHKRSPALMIFQHDQEIFVRPQQDEAIESLLKKGDGSLEFQSRVIQLIMGGGKSKVLLPILALQQATGDNLCIIEVPESLYETNLADLSNVSFRLFGQRACGFHFDRHSSCDHLSLKSRFRELEKISENRDYIITTKESMASLELKYHELLKIQEKSPTADRKKAIKWLDKIINFRKKQGDCLADEVDSTLDISQQINYTVGGSDSVPDEHIQSTLALFEFIDSLCLKTKTVNEEGSPQLETKTAHEGINMLSVLINSEALSPDILSDCCQILAKKLIKNPKSPLAPYLSKALTKAEQDELIDYLLNKTEVTPKAVSDIKDAVGIFRLKYFKGQLNHLLPHTLSLKHRVNYGPSEAPKKTPEQRAVTIPFAGNNEPKEKSKDTNHFKTINLSIQSNLITGIPEELLLHLIKKWREAAQKEFIKNQTLESLDDTEIAKNINVILTKAGIPKTLMTIPVPSGNKEEADLIKTLSKNREFIFYALNNEILPTLKIDTFVIVHNAQNHVSMYRSFRGVTGTPSNWRTMHQRIKYNAIDSLGTDGLTISRLIDKETKVHTVPYESTTQFLKNALEKIEDSKKLRCIIDIGATFKGIENKKVADELSIFISENKNKFGVPLQYILYFDKESSTGRDELYALPIGSPNSTPVSLKGKNKKEIKELLGCGPEACFTYYDQKHTIGSDIAQAPDAIAIATVDKNTLKKDLCQGVMRLRGFGGSQQAAIFVSDETAIAIGNQKLKLSDIIDLCEKNQIDKLTDAHFTATLEKMINIIREDLQFRILSLPHQDVDKKAKLQSIFEGYFISKVTNAVIDSYGAIEKEPYTREIFNLEAKHLLEEWGALVKKAGVEIPEILAIGANEKKMEKSFSLLINESLLNCKVKTKQVDRDALTQTAESEQQVQSKQEQAVSRLQKAEVKVTRDDESAKAKSLSYWTNTITLKQLESNIDFKYQLRYDSPTNTICRLRSNKGAPLLDTRFRETHNFHITADGGDHLQAQTIYRKQIPLVLMIQKQGILTPHFLTCPEAGHLKKMLTNPELSEGVFIWLSYPDGKFLLGKKPEPKDLDPSHDRLVEQMTFYNGELISSPDVDLTTTWIMENSLEKLNYFKKSLLPFSLMSEQEFKAVKNEIKNCQKSFEKIAMEKDLNKESHVHWEREFPLLNAPTRKTLEEFSEFLQAIESQAPKVIDSTLFKKFSTPFYFKILLQSNNLKRMNQYLEGIEPEILKRILLNQFESLLHYEEIVESLINVLKSPAIQESQTKLGSCFFTTLQITFKCSPEHSDSKIKAEQKRLVLSLLTDKAVFKDPEALIIKHIPLEKRKDFLKTLSVTEISTLFKDNSYFTKLLLEGVEPEFYKTLLAPESSEVFAYDSELFEFLLEHADLEYLLNYIKRENECKNQRPNLDHLLRYFQHVTNTIIQQETLSPENTERLLKCDNILKKLLPFLKDTLRSDEIGQLWNYAFSTVKPVASQDEEEGNYYPINIFNFLSNHLPPDSFSPGRLSHDNSCQRQDANFAQLLQTDNIAIQNFFFEEICTKGTNTYFQLRYLKKVISHFENTNEQTQKPLPELYYRASALYLFREICEQLELSCGKVPDAFKLNLSNYLALSQEKPHFFKPLSEIIIVNEYDKQMPIVNYLQEKAPEIHDEFSEHLKNSNIPNEGQATQPHIITVKKSYLFCLEQDIDRLYQHALCVDRTAFSKATAETEKISKYRHDASAFTCNNALKFILLHPKDEAIAKNLMGRRFLEITELCLKPLDPVLYGYFLTLASPEIIKIVEAKLRSKVEDNQVLAEILTPVLDMTKPLPLPEMSSPTLTFASEKKPPQSNVPDEKDEKDLADRPRSGSKGTKPGQG